MKRMLPVTELARDERFSHDARRRCGVRPAQPVAECAAQHLGADVRERHRQRPRSDARDLRRRDPGARRRRPHLLRLRSRRRPRPGAVRAEARHGPAVLGRGPPRRDQLQARRPHGFRDRRVRRADAALRGGVQPRPGAAPHRCQPGSRRSGHRRLQDDARLRQRCCPIRCWTSPRIGCWPTRSPT